MPGASGLADQLADAQAKLFDAAFGAIREKFGEAKASLYADAMGFVHAVDFTERWIVLLLVFHAVLWLVIVASRARANVQMFLFAAIVLGTCSAERLNSIGAARWQSFAGQNYFDKHGVFLSVMWSAPLLGDAFLIIFFALRSTARLLVQVKRAELRNARRAAAPNERPKAD